MAKASSKNHSRLFTTQHNLDSDVPICDIVQCSGTERLGRINLVPGSSYHWRAKIQENYFGLKTVNPNKIVADKCALSELLDIIEVTGRDVAVAITQQIGPRPNLKPTPCTASI